MYEVQTFLAFAGNTETVRSSALRSFVQSMNEVYPQMYAPKIPEVPEQLTREFFAQNYADIPVRDMLPIAIDYNIVNYVALNCYSQFMLALVGKNNMAKERFVAALIEDMGKCYFRRPVNLYIMDGFERKLGKYKDEAFIKTYTVSPEAVGEILEEVCEELRNRLDKLEDKDMILSRLQTNIKRFTSRCARKTGLVIIVLCPEVKQQTLQARNPGLTGQIL